MNWPLELQARLKAEAERRGLTLSALIPVLLEEYFQMWDDLEDGHAIMMPDEESADG